MKVTINLLPPDKKENLRIQQLTGTVLKIGFSGLFAGIVFLLFLYACLIIIDIKKEILASESAQLQKVEIYNEVQRAYDAVDKYYSNTQQIDKALSNQISHITLLEELNNLILDDLFLQEISIAEEKMVLNGFSSNRNSLIEFRDRLESSDSFGSVEAPISNFTASENVNFVFTIDISK